MKLLLVDPSYIMNGYQLGLGILTIAEISKEAGWEVDICEYIEALTLEDKCIAICNRAKELEVNAVGITTRCDFYPFALMIAKQLKGRCPQSWVFLGGPQATHTDVDTLRLYPYIDVIIRGEGEVSTKQLLEAIQFNKGFSDILGITYIQNGKIIRNQPQPLLDSVSYKLAWELLPKKYEAILRKTKKCGIESGRGCPYSCTFCCTNRMWDRHYRLRSAYSLHEEMKNLNYRFDINFFQLEHDSLMAGRHFQEFLRDLKNLNVENFKWSCSARIDNFDITLLKDLEDAGCERLYFGIESASPKMQKIYNKYLDIDTALEKIIYILKNSQIKIILSFICGHPQETISDILPTLEMTIRLIQYKNCINIQLHKVAPLNGSQLYQQYKNHLEFKGFISDQAHSDQIELAFTEEIKQYPELFASFFDFKEMKIPPDIVYNICYHIQPLCKSFARTISAIRLLTKISLLEIVNILSTCKNFEECLQIIETRSNHVQLPEIVYDIYTFELMLFTMHPTAEYIEFPDETSICNMINPTLRYSDIFFNPDEEITLDTLRNMINHPIKSTVMLWLGDQTVNYKVANELDTTILSSSIPYCEMITQKFWGGYILNMASNKLIKYAPQP